MYQPPFVSIIIPCYNEEKFIKGCLDSIIAGDYPLDRIEVLVIDGGSTDKTRAILADYCRYCTIIKMVNNPHRLKPHGLNIGIQKAKGDIIIRMDAHAIYDKSYVSKCVKYLVEHEADNVGGIRKTLAASDSIIAKSIAISISHPFAAGNAIYRIGAKDLKWVDTVFGGCYMRSTFEKIGFFDERLVRGQDREFNIRLQKAGGRILFAPDIICYYYPRSSLRSYIPWIFSAGMTPFFISRLVNKPIFSWRNFIPLFFILSLVFFLLLSLWDPLLIWLLASEILIYLIFAILVSISSFKREKDLRFFFTLPVVFALTHIVYGIGSFVGLLKPVRDAGEWTKV